jgi:hypothetical protein
MVVEYLANEGLPSCVGLPYLAHLFKRFRYSPAFFDDTV